MGVIELLILAGALAGGYVSGLTGFGTGLTALPFWLNAVHPVVAAPLVVVCSIIAHVQTLPTIWHTISWRRAIPFVVGGLLGVPIGIVLLTLVSPFLFKLFIGIFLILYCSFMLAKKSAPIVSWGGQFTDGAVGFGGGILGGLAGLSGPLPTVWASLRGWGKEAKRGVFQAFNFSILLLALFFQLVSGLVTLEVGKFVLIALPGTLIGAWLGRKTYDRLGDNRFDQVVLVILLLSGVSIVVTSVFLS